MPDTVDLGFSDRRLPLGAHICYLHGDADSEREEILLRFLQAGQRAGERLLYLASARPAAEQRVRFAAVDGEALEVRDAAQVYVPGGRFDARQLDGATIMDMLALHPWLLARGQLVENPLYATPETLLARAHGADRRIGFA